jgi:hypothetical protein
MNSDGCRVCHSLAVAHSHRVYRDRNVTEFRQFLACDDRQTKDGHLATIAGRLDVFPMTPHDLVIFRMRMGWLHRKLAHKLEISASRLKDYELGQTRTTTPRPAPIPKVVEALSAEAKAALWSDVSNVPATVPVDDSRAGLYGPPRGF